MVLSGPTAMRERDLEGITEMRVVTLQPGDGQLNANTLEASPSMPKEMSLWGCCVELEGW